MKRGESAGGGQSSLGYLFGSDSKQKREAPPPSPPMPAAAYMPPYGIDYLADQNQPPQTSSNNYHTLHAPNTSRPSTKVKSAPGGDSSLGYLFGDK